MNRRTLLQSSIFGLLPSLNKKNEELDYTQFFNYNIKEAYRQFKDQNAVPPHLINDYEKCLYSKIAHKQLCEMNIFSLAKSGPNGDYLSPQYHNHVIYQGNFPDRLWTPLTKFHKIKNGPANFGNNYAIGLTDSKNNLFLGCCFSTGNYEGVTLYKDVS